MATTASPVDDAEEILRRVAEFRSLAIDELIAQRLAAADVNYAEVLALLNKGCPKKLLARILA